MLNCQIPNALQLGILLIDLGLQALQFPAKLDNPLSHIGAGCGALCYLRRVKIGVAERRRRWRRQCWLRIRFCARSTNGCLHFSIAFRILACQGRP